MILLNISPSDQNGVVWFEMGRQTWYPCTERRVTCHVRGCHVALGHLAEVMCFSPPYLIVFSSDPSVPSGRQWLHVIPCSRVGVLFCLLDHGQSTLITHNSPTLETCLHCFCVFSQLLIYGSVDLWVFNLYYNILLLKLSQLWSLRALSAYSCIPLTHSHQFSLGGGLLSL